MRIVGEECADADHHRVDAAAFAVNHRATLCRTDPTTVAGASRSATIDGLRPFRDNPRSFRANTSQEWCGDSLTGNAINLLDGNSRRAHSICTACSKWIWISNCIDHSCDTALDQRITTGRCFSLMRARFERDECRRTFGANASSFQSNSFGVQFSTARVISPTNN